MKLNLKQEAYIRQNGICARCQEPFGYSMEDVRSGKEKLVGTDKHRPRRRADGGHYTEDNTLLTHADCHPKIHGNFLDRGIVGAELNQTVQAYKFWQKQRIARGNALVAVGRRMDILPSETAQAVSEDIALAEEREKHYHRLMENLVMRLDDPAVDAITCHKGVGPVTAALFLAEIDWEKADTASSLWSFFGLAGPSSARYTEGKTSGGKSVLRSHLFMVTTGFLKCANPNYIRFYYETKERYANSDRLVEERTYDEASHGWKRTMIPWKDASPDHRNKAALRYMGKMWLSHLWQTVRELRGLPNGPAYALSVLNHTHSITPGDCGWPTIAELRHQQTDRMERAIRRQERAA